MSEETAPVAPTPAAVDESPPPMEDLTLEEPAPPNTGDKLRSAFLKMGSETNKAWSTSMRNVKAGVDTAASKLRGTDKDEYMIVDTEEVALGLLKQMVESEKPRKGQKRPQKWNFATVPLACFDKTLDDVFMCFVRWAKTDDESSTAINVTSAFARLTAYATWMDNTGRDMIDPPLTTESIKEAWKAWNMKVSYDKAGHLVWWFDIDDFHEKTVKSMQTEESLRLFVWFAHFVMLDPQAQKNGCVLVENLGKIQLWNGLTLLPPNLARKIDRLTVGTMPVKMKQIYVCESPQWATVLMRMMKPFLSPIVKDRIILMDNPKLLEEILGLDCIPTGFVGTEGKLEKDIVWAAMSMD
jgi:hypothetical protein